MATDRRNAYLDAGVSDESDQDAGYDSEAAEVSKARSASKRRKLEHDSTDEDDDRGIRGRKSPPQEPVTDPQAGTESTETEQQPQVKNEDDEVQDRERELEDGEYAEQKTQSSKFVPKSQEPCTAEPITGRKKKKKKSKDKKERTPGVIYLSSLPPYLKPSALRNILEQRGFSPIARIFLSPASKSNKTHSAGGKNSRQLYTEGWIEFASKKTAKRCAETLNARTVGGKKGGYYRDDLWNMKYLRGMRWEELMAGVREEKREMEGQRDEERRTIARETRAFVEGVEEGRRREGMKRKREKKKDVEAELDGVPVRPVEADVRRTWRQNEVKGEAQPQGIGDVKISDDVKQVLGKIF